MGNVGAAGYATSAQLPKIEPSEPRVPQRSTIFDHHFRALAHRLTDHRNGSKTIDQHYRSRKCKRAHPTGQSPYGRRRQCENNDLYRACDPKIADWIFRRGEDAPNRHDCHDCHNSRCHTTPCVATQRPDVGTDSHKRHKLDKKEKDIYRPREYQHIGTVPHKREQCSLCCRD